MNWLKKLETALANEAEEIPRSWFSVGQLKASQKLSETAAKERLADGLRLGLLERRKFRVRLNGKFRRVYYYHEL